MLNFSTTSSHADIPLPASLAVLSVPERMREVMVRNRHRGYPTTRDDFHQALETCDLSDAELDASIGAASRLAAAGETRTVEPTYDRKRRIEQAATAMFKLLPSMADFQRELRRCHFTAAEVDDLYSDALSKMAIDIGYGGQIAKANA